MNKKSFTVVFAVFAVAAIAMLWWRVRRLENSVDLLTRQLQSKPGAMLIEAAQSPRLKMEQDKSYFHLIDSPPRDDGRTEVGVPWNVERAMMGDATQNKAPAREIPRHEIQNENTPTLLDELKSPLPEQQPVSPSSDGEFN